MKLHELACIGKDNIARTFYYDLIVDPCESDAEWRFRVHRKSPPQENADDWFELDLTRFDATSLRITMMENRGKEWYRGKGISDAIILEAARVLRKRIVSSSNLARVKENEYRTEAAEKVWIRLVARKQATYRASIDRYICQG